MMGGMLTHKIDNWDAMGWRVTFYVKIRPEGLIIQFEIAIKNFVEIAIKQGGTQVGKAKGTKKIGGTFLIPWVHVTPWPTPDQPPEDSLSLN